MHTERDAFKHAMTPPYVIRLPPHPPSPPSPPLAGAPGIFAVTLQGTNSRDSCLQENPLSVTMSHPYSLLLRNASLGGSGDNEVLNEGGAGEGGGVGEGVGGCWASAVVVAPGALVDITWAGELVLICCNSQQLAATHCPALQHTATHCNSRFCARRASGYRLGGRAGSDLLQLATTHCNTLQPTATYCNS